MRTKVNSKDEPKLSAIATPGILLSRSRADGVELGGIFYMSCNKQIHFYSKLIRNRPQIMPSLIRRRLGEAMSIPPSGVAVSSFGNVRFPVDMSIHSIARKYYFHTHEMFLEDIFRTYLMPGRIFIDVGANLGYWSAFAASLVGREGEVHAFEPVPRFFESVSQLAAENPEYKIVANNQACGSVPGTVTMQVVTPTKENYHNFETNIGSSSALPHFLDHDRHLVSEVEAAVVRLDDYIAERGIDIARIGLIKIDVEGYESYCFGGMPSILGKKGAKVPLLCEILTDKKRHELLDGSQIVQRLERDGYKIFDATTLRPMDLNKLSFEENVLGV